jgi:hypothetical protein
MKTFGKRKWKCFHFTIDVLFSKGYEYDYTNIVTYIYFIKTGGEAIWL